MEARPQTHFGHRRAQKMHLAGANFVLFRCINMRLKLHRFIQNCTFCVDLHTKKSLLLYELSTVTHITLKNVEPFNVESYAVIPVTARLFCRIIHYFTFCHTLLGYQIHYDGRLYTASKETAFSWSIFVGSTIFELEQGQSVALFQLCIRVNLPSSPLPSLPAPLLCFPSPSLPAVKRLA